MSKSPAKTALQTVDLSSYAKDILSTEDYPLFDDAVEAGKAGAFRAAYVMIWLACAESLKRRFREAQKRDGAAGKIVGEIETKEREHRAVDKFVLTKAHEYGFLSDSGHTVLNHIYEMRCIYGHPYEEAPSQEQVAHAAAAVVEHVLSKPVKLRHGFGKQLLKSLLEERNFLDDQLTTVEAFAKDILPRIDENIHGWLLDNYLEELEKISGDSSMAVFSRRGIWFSRTMLLEVGVDVFSHDDWHDRTSKFPKVLMRICGVASIFKEIGKRAQDSLVGLILAESGTRASVLTHLERLNNSGALTKRQKARFVEHVSDMEISAIRSAGLSTLTCYEKLIDAMKSYNWYVQNPAIDLIISNGPKQAAVLDIGQQENIGRNILQAGEGSAGSANVFLEKLSDNGNAWPYDVVRGIAFETFVNEENEIRFKDRCLSKVLAALDSLKVTRRKQLVSALIKSINAGTPKYSWLCCDDFQDIIDSLNDYPWSENFIKCLEKKCEALEAEKEEA
jgi:peptidoglycan/xylan/chitin deacetylase (PgdA/CDA1 family)